jgi:hypothetical protein
MPTKLLQICARATTFPDLENILVQCCSSITDWDALLAEAEQQGVAPLLHWHLQSYTEACPARIRMALRLLYLRHLHTNTVNAEVLKETIELFSNAGIEVLVLKGAALCHTIYPDIGLRPMRDIDILIRKEQARQAQDLLLRQGFIESSAPRPEGHFHLPSLHKKVQDIRICIELHTGLFPDCPPFYAQVDFDELLARARSFSIEDTAALCMGDEDMLWHVFEHGFHMPLTYEPYKLISVADIVTLVEKQLHTLDWQRIQHAYPRIMAALPLFNHLTPWQKEVGEHLSWNLGKPIKDAGAPFVGWPHQRMADQRRLSSLAILKRTFNPPDWWTQLYYGADGWWERLKCRLFHHPAHILWWVRLYSSYIQPKSGETQTGKGRTVKTGRSISGLFAAMRKLLRRVN